MDHQGRTSKSGHYIAWKKVNSNWYKCDDSVITEVNLDVIPSNNNYMFVYLRNQSKEENLNLNTYNPQEMKPSSQNINENAIDLNDNNSWPPLQPMNSMKIFSVNSPVQRKMKSHSQIKTKTAFDFNDNEAWPPLLPTNSTQVIPVNSQINTKSLIVKSR